LFFRRFRFGKTSGAAHVAAADFARCSAIRLLNIHRIEP